MIARANIQIKKPTGKVSRSSDYPTVDSIIAGMQKSFKRYVKTGYLKEFSKNFPATKQGMKKLYDFVRNNIKYKKDYTLREVVQSPGYLWHGSREGDCKSMSMFVAETLYHNNIPFVFRFVSDRPDRQLSHVYIAANINGEEITIDPTIPNFNKEMRTTNMRDLDPGVYSISGPSDKGYPAKIAPKRYINYLSMTSGEMYAALLSEQLRLLGDWYGDQKLVEESTIINNQLLKGIHGPTDYVQISGLSSNIANRIVRAKQIVQPATKLNTLKDRVSPGLGVGQIQQEDCYLLWRRYEEENGLRQRYSEKKLRKMRDASPLFQNCVKANEYIRIFNQHLEGSSHQLLYAFNPRPNEAPGLVSAKTVLQRNATSTLSRLSGIEEQNIKMWLANGIMRTNAQRGLSPLNPIQTYDIVEKYGNQSVEGIATIVAAATAIYKAVAAAVQAIVKIIKNMNKEDKVVFESTAQGVGSNAFGPQPDDWEGVITDQPASQQFGGDFNNLLLYAALAYGATKIIK